MVTSGATRLAAVVEKGKSGKWFVKLVNDGNHKTLNVSETYASKWNAMRAAKGLKKTFPNLVIRVMDGKEV